MILNAIILENLSTTPRRPPTRDRSAYGQDNPKLKAEVEALAASEAPDEEVLRRIVRLVHDAHPPWDWSGTYLMADGSLVVGPFAGSFEPPAHSRIEVGEGVCGTVRPKTRTSSSRTCVSAPISPGLLALNPLGARGPHQRWKADRRPV